MLPRRILGALGLLMPLLACARPGLPPEVTQALQRARVPEEAISIVLEEAGSGQGLLNWQADHAVNPASLAKLVTTYAALDRLGPAWSWRTPVWLQGDLRDGVLDGSLVLRGSGDPTLNVERLWLLLRRVQQLGVREIRGDIVLDRRAFDLPDTDPGAFDGEPLRPYNVQADALLLNLRSLTFTFTPDIGAGRARVSVSPPLAGPAPDRSVPLLPGPCTDWRATLKATFAAEAGARFAGGYPTACGELNWPVADPAPRTYNARLLEGLWREMGGQLGGKVRDGTAPNDRAPTFEWVSPTLPEVVRDINKFSNNVMAQQVFLSLASASSLPGPSAPTSTSTPATAAPVTLEAARAAMRQWLDARLGADARQIVLDHGGGLSRDSRLTAAVLARLLQQAWSSPVMPELMASLPVSGLDGTLRRAQVPAGRAHLKTGSLRDVAGVAGYLLSDSGRRYVLVAIVHHPQAQAARPALDALVRWALSDAPAR